MFWKFGIKKNQSLCFLYREENINSEKNFMGLIDSMNLIAENMAIRSLFQLTPELVT